MTYSKAAASVAVEQTELKAKRKLPVWVIYLLPSLLIFLLFTIYPFVKTFITSFFATSTTGAMTKFVGVQNYIDLFTNANYLQSLGTTFLYTLLTVPLTVIISLLLAVLSASNLPGMGVFRTILRVHHLADQRLSILRPHRYAHFRRPQQHHEPDGI